MNLVTKLKMSVQQRREMDDVPAMIEKLQANQDYIAMMSDIELEEESEASDNEY